MGEMRDSELRTIIFLTPYCWLFFYYLQLSFFTRIGVDAVNSSGRRLVHYVHKLITRHMKRYAMVVVFFHYAWKFQCPVYFRCNSSGCLRRF